MQRKTGGSDGALAVTICDAVENGERPALKPVGVPSNPITDREHLSREDPYRSTSAHVACHNSPSVPSAQNTVSFVSPVTTTSVMYGGSAKVDATIGSEAALMVELPTSLQALHLTAYVTPITKFDKIATSSTDESVMSESSVEHTNILAESVSRFEKSDTSVTSTKKNSAP